MGKRALISVFNKDGIVELAAYLAGSGWEILSTGGTARYLEEHHIPVTDVSSVTGFPECLDGRVKTLHPAIHAGLLARRDLAAHMETLERQGIGLIDLVCVNLYPFFEKAVPPCRWKKPWSLSTSGDRRCCVPRQKISGTSSSLRTAPITGK